MASHWWDKVKNTITPRTVIAIEEFMYREIVLKNTPSRKLTQLAFDHGFKDSAVLNIDWRAVCQYYMVYYSSQRLLKKLSPDKYIVGNSNHDRCEKCKETIDKKIYHVTTVRLK